jgi:transcriptional regulator with XRE-family HTH domain
MSEQLRSQLGNRLRELREKHGFTQQQLAQAIGKSWETISNFERGKTLPSLVTLEQLAGLLRLSMRDFFDNRVIEPSITSTSFWPNCGLLIPPIKLSPSSCFVLWPEPAPKHDASHHAKRSSKRYALSDVLRTVIPRS